MSKKRHRQMITCWSCRKKQATRRGKGPRWVCPKCRLLDPSELEFRREVSGLNQCVTYDGVIPNKKRQKFEMIAITSRDPRLRELADYYRREDLAARARFRRWSRQVDDPRLFSAETRDDWTDEVAWDLVRGINDFESGNPLEQIRQFEADSADPGGSARR